ncbi:DUF2280 domain-containing protein [Paraburkholderia silviterrae]|uniref:DUF2280 domain-containing protein n=1 Tax=Paraburkholderia silviterrae TaxID=2528715 RepID=A0A4R5MB98_9BURK|nr:DUF2280 domain-containing protein [Paraburkholderia silviterrae]TDG24034.1 DUF2280 domain-containing protein [Paraburkholderia silviterrae]
MATLTDDVKRRIVQGLACYDTPSQVARAIKEEFGLSVTPQQCEAYDPTKAAGKGVGKKYRAIFEAARAAYLQDQELIPIAHRARRLRILDRMCNEAEARGNVKLTMKLLEQAAKEVGGMYTTTHKLEHTGKGGGPIQWLPPSNEDLGEAEKIYRRVMGEQAVQKKGPV